MDKMKSLFLSSLLVVVSTSGLAQNPIIQTNYTADPAPMVYNDKVYLYTTHDEDNSTWFTMNDWRLYTTSDMVNWTDHGAVLSYTDFSLIILQLIFHHCKELPIVTPVSYLPLSVLHFLAILHYQ